MSIPTTVVSTRIFLHSLTRSSCASSPAMKIGDHVACDHLSDARQRVWIRHLFLSPVVKACARRSRRIDGGSFVAADCSNTRDTIERNHRQHPRRVEAQTGSFDSLWTNLAAHPRRFETQLTNLHFG